MYVCINVCVHFVYDTVTNGVHLAGQLIPRRAARGQSCSKGAPHQPDCPFLSHMLGPHNRPLAVASAPTSPQTTGLLKFKHHCTR